MAFAGEKYDNTPRFRDGVYFISYINILL